MPGNQTSHIPGKQLEHRGTFAYLKTNLAVNEGGWCIDDNLLYVKNAAGKLVPHSKVAKISVGTAYSTIVRYAYGNADCVGGVLPVIEGTQNSAYRYLYPEKFDPQGAFRFSAVCDGKYYWAECSSSSQWTTGEQAVDTAYAVYGVTSYSDVMAMLDGGTDTTGAKSKEMPLVCVLKYDTPIPYAGSVTYAPLTRGTTMPFTGIDDDGIHFGCAIAHSAGGTMPPLTIFVEALLNSQSVWSIKLRNSFQIAGIDSGSGAAVMSITPGMSTTAILQLDNATAADSKAYMLLPMTTISQGLPRISNMMFLGFDTSSGMTPGVKTLIRFAGTTFAGVNYPIQTPMMSVYTSDTSADAGLSSIDITVYKDANDLFGLTLRIGTEFLAIADPYARTKQYAVGDYCITSTGLYRLKTPYTPPADFDKTKWEKTTLIELIKDVASHALQSVATDSTLTGDGTTTNPLSVVGGGGGGGLQEVAHDDTMTGDGTSANPLSVADDGKRRSVANTVSLCEVQHSAANKLTVDSLSLIYTKSGLIKIYGYIVVSSAFTPSYSSNDKGGSQYWPSLFVIDVTDYPDVPNWSGNSIMVDRYNNSYLPIQFSYKTVNDRRYLSINASHDATVQTGNKEFLPYWM